MYPEDSFCNVCGKKVSPRPSQPAGSTPPPPIHERDPYIEYNMKPPPPPGGNLRKAAIIAACIALVALGVSIGGFFILRSSNNNQGESARLTSGSERIITSPTPETTPEATPEVPPLEDDESTTQLGGSERFPFPGTISRYSASATADVTFLQTTLNHIRRNFTSIRPIESTTGNFGGATRGAVADFQHRVGLPITGIVDETTWYSIMDVFENPPVTPDGPFVPKVQEGYITLVNLHLRDTPSQDGESLGVIPEGSYVWVVSYISEDSWFFVSTEDGYIGYMKAEFLILDGLLP